MGGGGSVTTDAIVLAAIDVGEDDRILTFLTPERGLLRAAATSARSLKKGRTASLDLFVLTRLDVHVPKKEGKLKRIRSIEMLDPFLGIRSDYGRLCAASYIGQTVAHCIQEEDPSSGTWELVHHCLRRLDSGAEPYTVLLLFELRFLREMGLLPEIYRCAQCGEMVDGKAFLDAGAGGIIHNRCSSKEDKGLLSAGDLAVLRFLGGKSISVVTKLSLKEVEARRIFYELHPFSQHHLGFESRALGMIEKGIMNNRES